MKRKYVFFIVAILLVIILVASCFGGKKSLAPGKYEVTHAVHELKDQDYELQVKNYGEYDVKQLEVKTNPVQSGMTLEITKSGQHILYVKSENDIIIDEGSSSPIKKKKKRR